MFKQHTNVVLRKTNIQKKDLFSITKKQEVVDARHLLFYLCKDSGISISYIQKYLKEYGLDITHSTIIYGVKKISNMMKEDKFVNDFINSLA